MSREVRYLSDCSVPENPDRMRLDETSKSHRAYHSSDNETTSTVRARTHTYARASACFSNVSRVLSSARYNAYSFPVHFFLSPFLFLGTKSRDQSTHNRIGAIPFSAREATTRVSRRSGFMCTPVRRDSRLPAIRDTHTYTRVPHARIYACTACTHTHTHAPHTV